VLAAEERRADAEHPRERPRARLREAPGERAAAGQAVHHHGDDRHADEHAAEQVRRDHRPESAHLGEAERDPGDGFGLRHRVRR